MKPITVLLSASGSQFAPGIINCLKKNGERKINIIGTDMSNEPSNRFFVDSFYQVPSTDSLDYVDEVLDICRKEQVDILLPQMSAELSIYLENLNRFQEIGTIVSMTKNSNVKIANNKLRLFEFMEREGIKTPKFAAVHSAKELEKELYNLGYPFKPVVVKIPDSSGARGVRIIDDRKSKFEIFAYEKPSSFIIGYDDFKTILIDSEKTLGKGNFPELMLMEYLPGDEFDIDLLAEDGKVLYSAGRRNPKMLMSITQVSILEKNERAENIAEKLVNALNLDGNLGFDFKFDTNGEAQLLEINPRIDATVSIFAAGGLNLPYLRIKQLLGEQLPKVDVQYGTQLKRRYLETFTDINGNLIDW